jgi:spore coat protein CotH
VRRDSTAWYLGYVEDGESAEMIEKKFLALEEYNKQLAQQEQGHMDDVGDVEMEEGGAGSVPSGTEPQTVLQGSEEAISTPMSKEQLETMFHITSHFSVQTAEDAPAPQVEDDEMEEEPLPEWADLR